MVKTKNFLSKIALQYTSTFEQLLGEIEDIYFGSIAHKALQKEDDYIEHAEVKKKMSRKK